MKSDPPEVLRALLRVVETFERMGIRYHLGGSFASSIHGVPRQTHGADLVAELNPYQADDLAAALGQTFYADADSMREAIRRKRCFNLVDLDSAFKVDIFVKGDEPFDNEEFERAAPLILDEQSGCSIFVKSAEDTLLRKLQWFAAGGSSSARQWTDVVGILKVQAGRLDVKYLRLWAGKLGLGPLLEQALSEA